MRYSPDWIFSISCSLITMRYVEGHIPLESYTRKISTGFNVLYDDLTNAKLNDGTEQIMRFLASFDHDNHLDVAKANFFNEFTFTRNGKKRKLSGMFSDNINPKKQETSVAENTKSFKAFFFRLRSDPGLYADPSWDVSQIKDFDEVKTILNSQVDIFDSF
jgi:hypothetical protein